ncbi:hypothetical protein Y032_0069g322 [Ancylostoma ceylanicum]|nr:hypothetical protein Y032_0069g322 [Ancylostoma ceylanicum]
MERSAFSLPRNLSALGCIGLSKMDSLKVLLEIIYSRGRPDSVLIPPLTLPRSRSAPPQQHGFIAAFHRL